MKYLLFSLALLPYTLFSQKHDYVWISGDSNTPNTTSHGGIIIDFNQQPLTAQYNYREMNMFVCNASICDSSGQLLAYTNGCHIAGADDKIFENGDTINPGLAWQISCIQNADGYASGYQSALFLPLPDTQDIYYLFHKPLKVFLNPLSGYPEALLASVLDMRLTTGQGKVIQKNVDVLRDTLAYGELLAVKHANGKDWWVVTPRRNSNTFYVLKFTKDGIVDTLRQTIGIKPKPAGEGYGQVVFSPDGTRMYRTNRGDPVMVYDFDRETGIFTHFDTISFDYGNQPVIGEIGCAVSPSGRFLYLGCRQLLHQLDLWSPDISASQLVVAEWDGVANPFATLFSQLQLGPNCKIYGLAGGDTRYFHVIHYPEEPGLACQVEQRGLPLPTPSGASMPSFPNYRLGPVDNPGLPCSPVVSVGAPPVGEQGGLVYPNPASDQLTFRYDPAENGDQTLFIFNNLGQLVLSIWLPGNQDRIKIATGRLQGGIYWYHVAGAKQAPAASRFIIQH